MQPVGCTPWCSTDAEEVVVIRNGWTPKMVAVVHFYIWSFIVVDVAVGFVHDKLLSVFISFYFILF